MKTKELDSSRISKLPLLIFFIILVVLQYESYITAFNQISSICTSFIRIYAVALCFNFLVSDKKHKPKDMISKAPKKHNYFNKIAEKIKLKKRKKAESPKNAEVQDSPEEDCLIQDRQVKQKKDLAENAVLKALYILLQLGIVARLAIDSF